MRKYIGRSFRDKLLYQVPDWYTDEEITDYLIQRAVCVHLGDDKEAKFDVVVFMIKKLFALVQDKCVPEGVDAVMMHEIVLGGHLYLQVCHRTPKITNADAEDSLYTQISLLVHGITVQFAYCFNFCHDIRSSLYM